MKISRRQEIGLWQHHFCTFFCKRRRKKRRDWKRERTSFSRIRKYSLEIVTCNLPTKWKQTLRAGRNRSYRDERNSSWGSLGDLQGPIDTQRICEADVQNLSARAPSRSFQDARAPRGSF